MNARELRIGNWIKDFDNGDEYQVAKITENGFVAGPMGVYPAGMEGDYGILLTAEWLTRFGFKFVDMMFENEPMRYFRKDKIIIYTDGALWLMNEKEQEIKLSVTTVHQLQNLYFALTGEELELETVKEKI